MKKILFLACIFSISLIGKSQIFSFSASASGPTNYNTVSFVDSIFYYCSSGNNGELTAFPPSGSPNFTFTWQQFDVATNSWIAYSVATSATSSTISNLAPGGYRVTITDGSSTIVGCYRAWIVNVLTPTTVDVEPIPPGCGAVPLHGTINWGNATPYYEPPPEPMFIDANTEITVCFTATHTFVSDLGFYMVSPATCGSVSTLLAPNPGTNCNSNNNISNLCFTTEPSPNFNVCTASTPLTGTYDSYGSSSTPINWSALYGCDASQPGWAVQIYDCVTLDLGTLQNATITFIGNTICGEQLTITYNSGNINSQIDDNSCSSSSASIFTVPIAPAIIVPYDNNYIWTANPSINIPGATTTLDPIVNPGPNVNTTFTLSLDTTGGGAFIPLQCGGNWQDSELYIYTPPTPASLSGPATICTGDAPVTLTANVPGGYWTGDGVNPGTGVFDPAAPGVVIGGNTIMYTVSNPCPINSFITINVISGSSTAVIPTPPNLCETGDSITLTATPTGGIWSGTGITDVNNGIFDPTATPGAGVYTISYSTSTGCPASGTIDITVDELEDASFTQPAPVCENASAFNLIPVTPGGTWSGTGVNSTSGLFDPSDSGDGSFVITYTVGACGASSQETVVVNPMPIVNASADQGICPGDSVQIIATGALTYSWSPSTDLSSTSIANPYASPSSPITYLVTGTDANGCSDTADVSITVFTPSSITFSGGTQVCEGDSLFLIANNVVSNIVWTPSNTVSNPNSASTYVFPSSDETYTVTGDDANGCTVSNSISIIVNTVDAVMSANPDNGTVPLTVDFTNSSSNGVMYIWNYGNGIIDTTYNLSSTQTVFETEGTYNVTLTAITAAGCMDVTSVTIYVFPECVVSVPNIFSPNGDNVNDLMKVICSQTLKSMNMQIFDRWGKKVIELNDPNQTWDGEGCSEGTYYYILSAEGFNETFYNLNGYITLSK